LFQLNSSMFSLEHLKCLYQEDSDFGELLKLVKFEQREILCFKEVIFLREHDYVCQSVEPTSSSLEEFTKDPWQGILVKTRPI